MNIFCIYSLQISRIDTKGFFMTNRFRTSFKILRLPALLLSLLLLTAPAVNAAPAEEKNYIKWIDFTPTAQALSDTAKADIESHGSSCELNWIDLLALLASKNGGNFSGYRSSDTAKVVDALKSGEKISELCKNQKLFAYYQEAYGAVLGGILGDYTEVRVTEDGKEERTPHYGIRAFSPLAEGYSYQHYDDFGASRSYGYKRSHLGHDLMGSVGTPVIAVESGYVEACGWNQYGGWRIGIRSFDGKRYYYYAHLRKNHPYNDMYEGKIVSAGEVIGYLGMTGYSAKKNTNNINIPHLHYGLEIIFHPSQKDGVNQIWIDMYALTNFLSHNRAKTFRDSAKNESVSRVYYEYPEMPD